MLVAVAFPPNVTNKDPSMVNRNNRTARNRMVPTNGYNFTVASDDGQFLLRWRIHRRVPWVGAIIAACGVAGLHFLR